MDKRRLANFPDDATRKTLLKSLSNPALAPGAESQSGIRIEITKTEERLVAYIDDPAKLERIYAHLLQAGQPRKAVASNRFERLALRLLPGLLAVAAIVIVGLSLALAYLLGSKQSEASRAGNRFYFSSSPPFLASPHANSRFSTPERSTAVTGARRDSGRVASGSPKAMRARDRTSETKSPSAIGAGTGHATATMSWDRSYAIDHPAALSGSPPLPHSRQVALDRAFETGAVQTWSERGEDGFVIADPVKQTGRSRCRTLLLWKRGAAQGDVMKSVRCDDPQAANRNAVTL